MESRVDWGALVLETIREPEETAERIMAWNLPRGVLYQVIILISALNVLVAGVEGLMDPSPDPLLGSLVAMPLVLFAISAGAAIASVHLIHWCGRMLGGTGTIEEMLVLFAWLQALRFAAQILVLATSLVFPALALILLLAVFILGVWLMVHFVKVGMRLQTLMQAVGVLAATLAGIFVGLMLIVTLIGPANLGAPVNV